MLFLHQNEGKDTKNSKTYKNTTIAISTNLSNVLISRLLNSDFQYFQSHHRFHALWTRLQRPELLSRRLRASSLQNGPSRETSCLPRLLCHFHELYNLTFLWVARKLQQKLSSETHVYHIPSFSGSTFNTSVHILPSFVTRSVCYDVLIGMV